MALAALAFTAAVASAQETEVEVMEEDAEVACNTCAIHIEGESHIRVMPAGVIVSSATTNSTPEFSPMAAAKWNGLAHPHVAPGCNTVNCTAGTEAHWPLAIGELGNGLEHVVWRFCLRAGASELHCNWEVLVEEQLPTGSHDYEFRSPVGGIACLGGARIVEGMWETEHHAAEGHQEIQILHDV